MPTLNPSNFSCHDGCSFCGHSRSCSYCLQPGSRVALLPAVGTITTVTAAIGNGAATAAAVLRILLPLLLLPLLLLLCYSYPLHHAYHDYYAYYCYCDYYDDLTTTTRLTRLLRHLRLQRLLRPQRRRLLLRLLRLLGLVRLPRLLRLLLFFCYYYYYYCDEDGYEDVGKRKILTLLFARRLHRVQSVSGFTDSGLRGLPVDWNLMKNSHRVLIHNSPHTLKCGLGSFPREILENQHLHKPQPKTRAPTKAQEQKLE